MDDMMRKLPIGIQDFEKLRKEGFLYVDKTEYIYRMVKEGAPCFLSRPRRFGKSLLLSTLKAYWEGKKELFKGLAIERLEEKNSDAWQKYPVFYFDFNKKNFMRKSALEEVLVSHLETWEKIYGDENKDKPLEERFQSLIVSAVEQTGKGAVVLVDEYDKPLIETIGNSDIEEYNKAVFKGFFSTLKSYDHYIKFVFFTGVTKFSKVSIFSDLNQLQDISIDRRYAGLCGITESELSDNFEKEINSLASYKNISKEECIDQLRRRYDGYHFYQNTEGVYNPFSLLNAFAKGEFGNYWFATGTPTFLIDKLRQTDYDVKKITEGEVYANVNALSDYRADNPDPLPLFFQTGYLTIKEYDSRRDRYTLSYPNDEVKYGFLESLVPYLTNAGKNDNGLDIFSIDDYIENGKTDELKKAFIALFSSLPYSTDERPLEQNFQNIIYIVFMLLGQFVKTEVHSAKGRADCIVETNDYVYVFEFKRDKSAKEALDQIDKNGYALVYAADRRKVFRIGVNFDSNERNITEWTVEEK